MIRRPPRSTHCISSAASDVYKRQSQYLSKNLCLSQFPQKSPLYYQRNVLSPNSHIIINSNTKSCSPPKLLLPRLYSPQSTLVANKLLSSREPQLLSLIHI
eukprot:TRINITY_DN2465_c0_g1_i1.p2 TRINITY_DN2465_c0_g1~~TRINITY_DN2465_c0_g1_i1.p2  ORF type:complete len:101 (+),score=18.05 TRINITY_DN2465_c0_g1_i1:153-455(+)